MEQNSDQWLEWRRKGLGASDAPIVMGVSPWKTPFQLWEEKLGIKGNDGGNWATQRGHEFEPKAKAWFEMMMNMDFPDTLAVHEKYEWLRASLDGYNKDANIFIEIKYCGKEDFENALKGIVPEKYIPQVQDQFLVTGAEKGYYVCTDGERYCFIELKPDTEYITKELFPKMEAFWNNVLKKKAPDFTDKDQLLITDKKTVALSEKYCKLDERMKKIKLDMEKVKEQLSEKVTHPKAKIGRITFTRAVKIGRIDYKAVPEIEGVDLEKYRGATTTTVTLRIKPLPKPEEKKDAGNSADAPTK